MTQPQFPPHLTALSLLQLFAQACPGQSELPTEATRGLTWPQACTLPNLDEEEITRLVHSFVLSVRAFGGLAGLSDEETEQFAELVARAITGPAAEMSTERMKPERIQ